MRRLSLAVAALVLLALALTPTTAEPGAEQPVPPQTFILSADDVALWQAWIRADLPTVYSLAQQMQSRSDIDRDTVLTARRLQRRAADELGWQETHLQDLETLLQDRPDDAHARFELVRRLYRMGRLDDIPPHHAKLGTLSDWWVAGPFANERGQGFEDAQEPEQDFHPTTEYIGKDGQLVRWRQLPGVAADGTINLGAMMRPKNESVAYLMTALHVEARVKAELFVGSDQAVRAWMMDGEDRQIILQDDVQRPLGFDQSRGSFMLEEGWNLLMVKAGNGEGDWKLRTRIEVNAPYRVARDEVELAEATENLARIDFPFAILWEGWRQNLHAAIRELVDQHHDNSSGFARRRLNGALERLDFHGDAAPAAEHAVLHYMAALANRSTATVTAGREENRRRELLLQCLEHDPKAARAAHDLAQYYTSIYSNPTLADKYASKAVALAPGWAEARLFSARVVAMKGLSVEVERELHKLVREYPENSAVLRFAGYYAGLRRQYERSNRYFARALEAEFTDGYSRDRLIERAVERGDHDTLLRYARKAISADPFDLTPLMSLAEFAFNAREYEQAEQALQQALAIAPRDDDALEKLGKTLSAWADATADSERAEALRARALAAFRNALDANPNRDDIERYLDFRAGGTPPFEQALQVGQPEMEERLRGYIESATPESLDADNPYEVLFREQIVVVNEDGTTHTYTQEAYRVTNDAGRERLRVIRTPMWSDQQGRCVHAEVWRADGWREEGRRSRWSATFPPLDVGDIVHVRFRVSDIEQSFFGDFYGTREVLADYVPVHELRLHWVLPQGREFFTYRTKDAPEHTEQTVNGRRVWSWVVNDIPRLVDEPLAPPPHQRAATVQISTWGNWHDFGRWYYNLIRRQLVPTPEMIAQVNALMAQLGDKRDSERERARIIYEWVVTNIRYNADWHFGVHGYKPFSAGAVFARRIGDCKDKAIVLCAMLEIAGVRAYPVIIALEEFRGHEDITLPIPEHFNHVIVYIQYSDGEGQYVDGTTTYHGFDDLPSGDAGAQVIIVRPDGGEHATVPLPKPGEDRTENVMHASLQPGGTLRLEVTRRGYGDSSSVLRARYQRSGEVRRRLESEWSRYYSGARVTEFETSDLSNLRETPELRFTVELPNAWREVGNNIQLRLAPNPQEWNSTDFTTVTSRRADLMLPTPLSRINTMYLEIPEGREVTLPEDVELQHKHVRVSVRTSMEDGKLVVRREWHLLGGVVSPDDYSDFRRTLSSFDEAEDRLLRLRRE
jgi:cellulose synthase operon protein C